MIITWDLIKSLTLKKYDEYLGLDKHVECKIKVQLIQKVEKKTFNTWK